MANPNRFLDYDGVEILLGLIKTEMQNAGYTPPTIITDVGEINASQEGLPTGGVLYTYVSNAISGSISAGGLVSTYVGNTLTSAVATGGVIYEAIKTQIDGIDLPSEPVAITEQEIRDLMDKIFGSSGP